MRLIDQFHFPFSNFLALLMIWGLSNFAAQSQVRTDYLEAGKEALDRESYQEAIYHFDTLIRKNRYIPAPYFYRALAKEKLKDYKGALTDYSLLLELEPEFPEALFGRGVLRYKLGHYQFAREDFEKVLAVPATETQAVYFKIPHGEGGSTGVMTMKNRDSEVFNYLGMIAIELEDYQGAIQHFDEAILKFPEEVNYYANRGRAREQIGDYSGAIEDYRLVLGKDPQNPIAAYNLANLATRTLDDSLSLILYGQIIEDNPDFSYAYIQRGFARYNLGDYRGALDDYDQVLKFDDQDPQNWLNRGLAKEKLSDYQGALHDFTRALDLQDDLSTAFSSRANVWVKLKKYQEAIYDYDLALLHEPEKPSLYYNRAVAKYYAGKKNGACEDARKAIQLGMESAQDSLPQFCN